MFNVGGGELLVIFLVALIVLGPQRLPDAARTVGRVVGEVRKISAGFQRELRDAFQDAETGSTATRRDQVVSLSSAVADLDRRRSADDEAADDEVDDDLDGEVAPEVGAALDQIAATPSAATDGTVPAPPAAAPADPPAARSAAPPADESAPAGPGDPPGPQRAAS